MNTCAIDGCERPIKVKSTRLCHAHDMQMRRTGNIKPPPKMAICSVEGCERAAWANGLCHRHDQQQKRTGAPLTERERLRRDNEEARILLKRCQAQLDALAVYGDTQRTLLLVRRIAAFLGAQEG